MSLRVENLCVKIGEKILVNTLSFELKKGEILSIIGPNGAGKTSLIRALAGEQTQHSGGIFFADQAIEKIEREHKARTQSYLPQTSHLSFPFTARDVVDLGRIPHASGRLADLQTVNTVMKLTDTLRLADKIYPQLSGGEKQRVQLARVLAQIWNDNNTQERLLLLDEPFSAVDVFHRQALSKVFKELASQGCSIVMVIHDFSYAAQNSNQVLALREGREACYGSPEQVMTSENLKKIFDVDLKIIQHPDTGLPIVI